MGQGDKRHRAWELRRRELAEAPEHQSRLLQEIPASPRIRQCSSSKRTLQSKGLVSDEAFFDFAHSCRASRRGQPKAAVPHSVSYTLNDDPQPQVLFTFGFSNLKPAPSSDST